MKNKVRGFFFSSKIFLMEFMCIRVIKKNNQKFQVPISKKIRIQVIHLHPYWLKDKKNLQWHKKETDTSSPMMKKKMQKI